MNENLKISLIQTEIHFQDVDRNLIHFERLISTIKSTDIILLPEMFNTSFCPKENNLAEDMNGKTISWMKRQSRLKGCSIAGTLMIKSNNRIYNRLVWITRGGEIYHYDKRHLFSLIDEGQYLEKGKERLIINDYGWKFCPLICYDLRFPVFSRNDVNYDVLIYLSNWPVKRINAWDILLKARSIENQCYTLGLNRIGFDENGIEYNGRSKGINPYGYEISSCGDGEENIIEVILESKMIREIRKKTNFLNDQDNFLLNNVPN